MKDMKNHLKKKKSKPSYFTSSLFSYGLFTILHRDPRAPKQCHWKQQQREGQGEYRRS